MRSIGFALLASCRPSAIEKFELRRREKIFRYHDNKLGVFASSRFGADQLGVTLRRIFAAILTTLIPTMRLLDGRGGKACPPILVCLIHWIGSLAKPRKTGGHSGRPYLLDATGLPRGVSRSLLRNKKLENFTRCHGLGPWTFTLAATDGAVS
jgi:hypothetical protein